MLYVGIVTVKDKTFQFRVEGYELYIFDYSSKTITWNDIYELVKNEWIVLEDVNHSTLYLKVENACLNSLFEYKFDVLGYISIKSDSMRKINDYKIKYNEICMQSDIIDCFFRNDSVHKQEIISLLANDQGIEVTGMDKKRPEIALSFDNTAYNVRFTTLMQPDYETGINRYNNAILVSANTIDDVEQAWKVVSTVRIFLQFISQTKYANFYNPIRLIHNKDYSDDSVYMYIRPDTTETIRYSKVIEYCDIRSGIGKLMEMIYRNNICYRSLFPVDYERVTYSDIMNICAAFECQYEIRYKKRYKAQKQEDVKCKILSLVEQNKSSIIDGDEEAYNVVVEGIKYVNETLKNRIQEALNSFVEIYGEQQVRLRFSNDFEKMPERIKNSRNYLDHGNVKKSFTKKSFTDAELLRAVVYMMIIESAGITEKGCIIRIIDKVANNL